jgi:hypothetical protein
LNLNITTGHGSSGAEIYIGSNTTFPYTEHFLNKQGMIVQIFLMLREHVNFFADGEEDSATGPVIISFEAKNKDKKFGGAKAIVRMKQAKSSLFTLLLISL